MEDTLHIEITNQKAKRLIQDLVDLDLIKVIPQENDNRKTKLSDKYRGILTEEEGKSLQSHIKEMRSEWNNI